MSDCHCPYTLDFATHLYFKGRNEPVFRRVVRNISRLLSQCYLPRTDGSDPVEWRPREYNSVADALCNLAMDSHQSYEQIHDGRVRLALANASNLQIYSDGGFRSRQLAALGWALYNMQLGGADRTLLACGSVLLTSCESSFQAEVLALDLAMAKAVAILVS